MYYITWIMQYLTLVLTNIGFILLAARSLKVWQITDKYLFNPYNLSYYSVFIF